MSGKLAAVLGTKLEYKYIISIRRFDERSGAGGHRPSAGGFGSTFDDIDAVVVGKAPASSKGDDAELFMADAMGATGKP